MMATEGEEGVLFMCCTVVGCETEEKVEILRAPIRTRYRRYNHC